MRNLSGKAQNSAGSIIGGWPAAAERTDLSVLSRVTRSRTSCGTPNMGRADLGLRLLLSLDIPLCSLQKETAEQKIFLLRAPDSPIQPRCTERLQE